MPDTKVALASHFTVEIQDAVVGRFAECSGLSVEYEILEYEEGGENRFVHRLRGRMKYPNLVLRRGVTDDQTFQRWLFQSKDRDRRGSVTISMLDSKATAPVRQWSFASAVPIRWVGPEINVGENQRAMEMLEIAHEGLVPGG